MPLRVCTVSFKSATGTTHAVDIEAETLYEAAGVGLARLKKDGWIEGLRRRLLNLWKALPHARARQMLPRTWPTAYSRTPLPLPGW
jgi:hypothetical protein